MPLPSVAQITKALALAKQIESMEAELASIMGGSTEAPKAAKRGRPPGKAAKRGRPPGPAKKKGGMSEEGRKRIAEAQKKRWAEKKKADGKK